MSVTLGLGAAPYQKTLPASLLHAQMLRRLFDLGPFLEIHEPDGNGRLKRIRRFSSYRFATRVLWSIWWRGLRKVGVPPPIEINVWLADRLLANWIPPSTVFHGMTANCLTCLQVAKRQGSITLLQTASWHPRHWQEATIGERRRFDLDERDGGDVFSERMIRRMEREYQACDKLIALSHAAQRSFEEFGYGHKTVVVLPGIDHTFFTPSAVPSASTIFRLCYVGRVELAKGIGYLLQAWKRLALPNAELLLIGEVMPDIKMILKKHAMENVILKGFLPAQQVLLHYRQSSAFVFPSVSEGFGLVLLEAMACGLPVIVAEDTGAEECVNTEREGLIVPPRNVDALAEAILRCYKKPDECLAMGRQARARIESQFTLNHYNERQISLYRLLANERRTG